MGNQKMTELRAAREQAQAALREQADRAARAERIAGRAWAAQDRIVASDDKLAAALEKAQRVYDEAVAKAAAKLATRRDATAQTARQAHDVAAGRARGELLTALRELLDDGHSAADVAALTGISAADVRDAKTSDAKGGRAASGEPGSWTEALPAAVAGHQAASGT